MEAPANFMRSSVYSNKNVQFDKPQFDLFQLTSELNRSDSQTKFLPVNNLCAGFSINQSPQIKENKPFCDNLERDYQQYSSEDCEGFKRIIKDIPIYRDILKQNLVTLPKPVDIAVGYYELAPAHNDFRELNFVYENNPKSAGCYKPDQGYDLMQNNWSSFQTMISSGSSQDNSHPLNEENIMKSMNMTHDIKNNFADGSLCTAYNMTMCTYANQPQNYGPILVPEGSNLYIPPGYIRVDAQKSNVRTTKQITNCEHVNRKHYAKGLCSTCYHKGGRTKLAWNCEHRDRLHYAKGCCTDCYVQFHSTRGKGRKKDQADSDFHLEGINGGNYIQ